MKTTVDANLFRLVNATASKEETRYYLNGVSIEPHHDHGAILVSTDGHRMLVAYDENATCEERVIIKLAPYALQQCKHKPMFGSSRVLEIDSAGKGAAKIIQVTPGKRPEDEKKYDDVLTSYNVLINGTFPDWRKVVPDLSSEPPGAMAVGFNTKYMREFGALGVEIANTIPGAGSAFVIHKQHDLSPTVIRWSGARNIFGVFMPMRFDERDGILPSFISQPIAQAAE